MAEVEATQQKPIPTLGAKTLKGFYGAIKSAVDSCTKSAAEMDDGPVKEAIGGHVAGISNAISEMTKSWGKFYKDMDIDEPDEDPETDGDDKADPPAEDAPAQADDSDIDGALDSLDSLIPEDDDDKTDETPAEPATEAEKRPDEKSAAKITQTKTLSEAELRDMETKVAKRESQVNHLIRRLRAAAAR